MKSVTGDLSASTAKSKAISDNKSAPSIPAAMLSSRCALRFSFRLSRVLPEPMIPERMSIHDAWCTKWDSRMHYEPKHDDSLQVDTTSVGQFYIHRLIWSSSAVEKLVELSAHCPHDYTPHCCNCPDDPLLLNAIRKSKSEVIEKDYKERMGMRLEEANRILEGATRRQEEARRRLGESERLEAESNKILFQAMETMEKADRISEETWKMEEEILTEFKERMERSVSEFSAWAEREISEAMQRLVKKELVHSGRDSCSKEQLIQVHEP